MPEPVSLTSTPSIAARSLGRLLGIETLTFKLESVQPTGSWLDRSAAVVVREAAGCGWTGLGVVGLGAPTVSLAVQCARAGLRMVVLMPFASGCVPIAHPGVGAGALWLDALGVQFVAVDAAEPDVHLTAPASFRQAGLLPVPPDAPMLGAGLLEVLGEVDSAGNHDSLLAVPALTGHEAPWLRTAADARAGTMPLPLDGVAASSQSRAFAILGTLGGVGNESAPGDPVMTMAVSEREADAARRLLAREEGILASRQGAVAFAAFVRALREDRAKRPRERRLREVKSVVAIVTGDAPGSGDAPQSAADRVPGRVVRLDDLAGGLTRVLAAPPGRGPMA